MINTLIFGLPTLEDIQMGVLGALRTVLLNLCEAIYKVITFCFNIFLELGQSEILDNESIQEIYVRVGLILGLFMIFRITFSAIEYLINPDTMLDKQKGIGNIVKKVLIVIVLLGSTQFLFREAYDIQESIIDNDIISKVILGYQDENSIKNKSGTMIASIFTPFYYPTDAYSGLKDSSETVTTIDEEGNIITIEYEEDDKELGELCQRYLNSGSESPGNAELYQKVRNNDFELAYACLNVKGIQTIGEEEESQTFLVNYDGFISLAVAIIILYVIITYTIQVGVRVLQLAYLQLIAPIPIMSYLMPNGDDKLKKWGQQCLTTFLDFFIRIAIMDFIIKIITILANNDSPFFGSFGTDNELVTKGYVTVIMIVALLIFAKKVPELLKEIFPSSGGAAGLGFGIKSPKAAWGELKKTPLAWGPNAIGWSAKKAIGFVDRKVHGLPKPPNKLQEKLDKIAPGAAEARKNRRQSIADARAREEKMKRGQALYKEHGENLPPTVFKSEEYRKSYQGLGQAKKQSDTAEKQLRNAKAMYDAAYNSGNKDRIDAATKLLDKAEKENKIAHDQFERAKENHKMNQHRYDRDAKVEESYNTFKDNSKEYKGITKEEFEKVENMNASTSSRGGNPSEIYIPNSSNFEEERNQARQRNNNNNNQNNN